MKFLTFIAFLICSISYGQSSKQVKKLIGEGFVEKKASESYSLIPSGDNTFYPSWTEKGDTTGASNGTEFLLFEDSISFYSGEQFKFFKTAYVTNADWDKFFDRVVDSISREKVFLNTDPTSMSVPKKVQEKFDKLWVADGSDLDKKLSPFIWRSYSHWNYEYDWRKEIKPHYYHPLLSDMYLRYNERFWNRRPLDDRKINYRFTQVRTKEWKPILGLAFGEINVSKDHDVWAASSKCPYDIHYNLSHYYGSSDLFIDEPVVGVLGTQIKAYLEFVQEGSQKRIDEMDLPYFVRVSLPSQAEIEENKGESSSGFHGIVTEKKDMTAHWQITNQNYANFLGWIEDSIKREVIYLNMINKLTDKMIGEMLDYDKLYYDEVNLMWQEFDPSMPYINRGLFNFNYDFDWSKKLDKTTVNSLLQSLHKEGEFKRMKYGYKYYWVDYERRSRWGEMEWKVYKPKSYDRFECTDFYKGCRDYEMSNGVRRNEDIGRFILEEQLCIYPGVDCRACNELCSVLCKGNDDHVNEEGNYIDCGRCSDGEWEKELSKYDFESKPDSLIQRLTYHQALAYYNWKYQKANVFNPSETAIYDDLVPSEEEFKRVQAGEKMMLAAKQIPYPSPLFRYVVHFYKK